MILDVMYGGLKMFEASAQMFSIVNLHGKTSINSNRSNGVKSAGVVAA